MKAKVTFQNQFFFFENFAYIKIIVHVNTSRATSDAVKISRMDLIGKMHKKNMIQLSQWKDLMLIW